MNTEKRLKLDSNVNKLELLIYAMCRDDDSISLADILTILAETTIRFAHLGVDASETAALKLKENPSNG